MRKTQLMWLAPLFLILLAVPAFAAFDGSHHDLRAYSAAADGCGPCHGRRTAASVLGSGATATSNYGSVGALCLARCHTAQGILTDVGGVYPVGAPSVVMTGANYTVTDNSVNKNYDIVTFLGSHGRDRADLQNNSGAAVWAPNGTITSNWAYIGNNSIECTTCHLVHNNNNAPFLNAPLAPSAAGQIDGLCEACHTERATLASVTANANGMHPVNIVVDPGAAALRSGGTPTRRPRRINVQGYNGTRIFDVPNLASTALTGGAAAGNQWALGGHLVDGQNAAMTTSDNANIMGCFTCHSAHRSNESGEQQLAVVATNGPNEFNALCVGCHGNATTLGTDNVDGGVGMTGFDHPCGAATLPTGGLYSASTNVNLKFAVNSPAQNIPKHPQAQADLLALTPTGRINCLSCHTVHYGQSGTMALANLGTGGALQTAATDLCKRCHNGAGIPDLQDVSHAGATTTGSNAANAHHVTRSTALAYGTGIAASGGGTGDLLTIAQPSWANTTNHIGDLSRGMDCADCHVFNGTAHNW